MTCVAELQTFLSLEFGLSKPHFHTFEQMFFLILEQDLLKLYNFTYLKF